MSTLNEIADDYVERAAALDPVAATYAGVPGHDERLPDLTRDGYDARAELDRSTLRLAEALAPADGAERVARLAMLERLGLAVEAHETGDDTRQLNVIASDVQNVRQVFDLMPTEGEQAQSAIAKRMAEVPRAYRELGQTLFDSARDGRVPSRRQVVEVAKQCANWSRPDGGVYAGLVARLDAPETLRGELGEAARSAEQATAELGEFLTRELLPLAVERDAVGRERYARASRAFLGATVDLDEAYEYGWSEVARLGAEQRRVAGLIRADAGVEEAMELLDADPARRISGRENFRAWMQDLAEQTIGELHGVHFDIPEPARRIEACLAPTGDGGVYYTGPSEDCVAPRAHVVVGAGRGGRLLHLAGGHHRLPRGSSGPSPADLRGHRAAGVAQPLAAADVLGLRARRGLGPVRGAADGRARIPRGPGRADGHAGHADAAGRARGRRHRRAPGAGDPRGHDVARVRRPRRGDLERRARLGLPARALAHGGVEPALRTQPVPRLAGAGAVLQARREDLARVAANRSRPARAPRSTSRTSTTGRSPSAPWASTRSSRRWPRCKRAGATGGRAVSAFGEREALAQVPVAAVEHHRVRRRPPARAAEAGARGLAAPARIPLRVWRTRRWCAGRDRRCRRRRAGTAASGRTRRMSSP